jgi:hypothetical protein
MLDELVPLADPTAVPRVLTRADAIAFGYTRSAVAHRLATGRWRRVLPRTYLTADTLTWSDRLVAALAFAGGSALLTGAAALATKACARYRAQPRPGAGAAYYERSRHRLGAGPAHASPARPCPPTGTGARTAQPGGSRPGSGASASG